MAIKHVNADDKEPEESNFKIPSESEHLLQVTDITPNDEDSNIFTVKLEVIGGGDQEGLTLLQRTNIDDTLKGFYYTRLFLKAVGEPYKGSFDIDVDRWVGRQFYATVKHSTSKNKVYANIDTYNFEKRVEQQYKAPIGQAQSNPDAKTTVKAEDIAWEE